MRVQKLLNGFPCGLGGVLNRSERRGPAGGRFSIRVLTNLVSELLGTQISPKAPMRQNLEPRKVEVESRPKLGSHLGTKSQVNKYSVRAMFDCISHR